MLYTYTKLIQGRALAYNICAELRTKARKSKDFELVFYYARQCDEHTEAIKTYKLARAVSGDNTVLERWHG